MSMGAQMKVIEVALRANVSQYSAGLGLAAAQTKAFGKDVTDFSGTTEKGLKSMATGATIVGAGMLAGFGIAAAAAANFGSAMSEVEGATGANVVQMGQLRQAALDAGQATVFSASEAATAQAELGKAGVSTANILGGALTGSLNLAAAGGMDLARAAEVGAFAMNTFSLSGGEMSHVADVLAAGANKSAADVDGMAQSLQQTGLVSAQFGIGLEDTVGTLSMFAQAGLQGSDAGTSMKTMLQAFTPKSAEAKTAMRELNLEFFDAHGNFVGLEDAAEQLQTKMAGLTQEQRVSALQTIFGTDAIRAASILYRQGGEGVSFWAGQVNDAGYAAEMARIKNNNLKGDLEELQGTIEVALITTGERADGALRSLTQSVSATVEGLSAMPPVLDAVTMGVLGVGGAVLTGAGIVGSAKPKYDEFMKSLAGAGTGGERAAKGIGMLSTGIAVALPGLLYAAKLQGDIEKAGDAIAKQATQGLEGAKSLQEYGDAINQTIDVQEILQGTLTASTENAHAFGTSLTSVGGAIGLVAGLAGQSNDWAQILNPFDENTISNMENGTTKIQEVLAKAIPGYTHWAEVTKQLRDETGMTDEEITKLAATSGIDLRGAAVGMAEDLGLSEEAMKELTDAGFFAADSTDSTVQAMLAARDAANIAAPAVRGLGAGFGALSGEQLQAATSMQSTFLAAVDATSAYQGALDRVAEAQRGVETAGRGVANAQRAVQDAVAGVADAQQRHTDSYRAVQDAQERYADSLKSEADALGVVEEAKRKLDEAMRGPTENDDLSIEGAQIRLEEARRKMAAGGFDDDLDERRARLDLRRAELDLQRIQDDIAGRPAEAAANLATAEERLVAAHGSVEDAAWGIEQANRGVADAADGVARANRAVTDASLGVADAQRAQSAASAAVSAATDGAARAAMDLHLRQLELGAAMQAESGASSDLLGELELLKQMFPETAAAIQPYIDKLKALQRLRNEASNPNYGKPFEAGSGFMGPQGRAVGGPVSMGQPYRVHPNEIFVPNEDGMILPAHDSRQSQILAGPGGGGAGGAAVVRQVTHRYDVTLRLDNYMGDKSSVMREIREELRVLERSTAGRD